MAFTEPGNVHAIDFVSRHSISYINPRSNMQGEETTSLVNADGISRKYVLCQTSPNTQTLEPTQPTSEPLSPTYSTTSHPTGGFMNRHPHMVITKHESGLNTHLAEVRFEIYGYGTTIEYKDAGIVQTLDLSGNHEQRYHFSLGAKPHWWQPLGPSKAVMELINDDGKRVALFVRAEEVTQRRASAPATSQHFETEALGEIHIMDEFAGGPMELDQVLCTAVVVVERARRRATNPGLASWESVSSKVHYPGRRISYSEEPAAS